MGRMRAKMEVVFTRAASASSDMASISSLLVMFGVLGGLSAFGLVGALVGPTMLAIGLATWREWAAET